MSAEPTEEPLPEPPRGFSRGSTAETVRERTGWTLGLLPDAGETRPPTADELAALHRIDKEGFWRR